MTERLPIAISVNAELADRFLKIHAVTNKLEAQFNFHTLAANWYGDDENILLIQLTLETPSTFASKKAEQQSTEKEASKVTVFSDDVFNCFNSVQQQLDCHVAITSSEIELLKRQPKLLAGFLHKKLQKVFNLIAKQQSLTEI